MSNWLDPNYVRKRSHIHRPFEEAREFVRGLGLKKTDDWKKYCQGKMPEKGKRPKDIPSDPGVIYAKVGWINMKDWLGSP